MKFFEAELQSTPFPLRVKTLYEEDGTPFMSIKPIPGNVVCRVTPSDSAVVDAELLVHCRNHFHKALEFVELIASGEAPDHTVLSIAKVLSEKLGEVYTL